MAGSVNKVILIGNLGREPEMRRTPGGDAVTEFSMATKEIYTDKNGNRKEETEWHNIVLWRKLAENADQYIKKGSSVYIEGKLKTRSWEDNGQRRYRTEIIASSMQFMDSKSSSNDNQQDNIGQGYRQPTQRQGAQMAQNPPSQLPVEDDLPF